MSFEINDGKEHLPDEEDVYGVNDIEERERFEALFGGRTQEERVRRRKRIIRWTAALVILAFLLAMVVAGRQLLGW